MPYYAFQASALLEKSLRKLQGIIDIEGVQQSHPVIGNLKDALVKTETNLLAHVQSILERENSRLSSLKTIRRPDSLSAGVKLLRLVLDEAKTTSEYHGHHEEKDKFNDRNALESLLFRLIVVLQLTLVRIGDIHYVIQRGVSPASGLSAGATLATGGAALGTLLLLQRRPSLNHHLYGAITMKLSLGMISALYARRALSAILTRSKVNRCVTDVEDWNEQWTALGSTYCEPQREVHEECNQLDVSRLQKFFRYSMKETQRTPFWHSIGEMRFMMLKRAMDVFYASVGTANQWMHFTGAPIGDKTKWQLTLASAAAASFYSLIGANTKAVTVTSSSESARDLLQSAWGLVSLPSIKTLSLQASRLIKGACVADRIEIAGVSCFVLSKDPAPELAAAIRRCQRRFGRPPSVKRLTTIDEIAEQAPDSPGLERKPFAQPCGRFCQRDVIFHLTGGGFFAHIIASDLPYLLDWSAATGAVVICPEYALLPNHAFPDALHEVEDVYRALLCEENVQSLGFAVNRIVVTGESAGGNLAAALCVKLSIAREQDETIKINSGGNEEQGDQVARLPDALMLSCAVLNLSLDLTYSRVAGTADPVLPSGLISAISEAYLPEKLGVGRQDPLASPIYAKDSTLAHFPPTMLFASSNDPLLDDSVVFNKRLRDLGVDSELRAVPNLPHAYLGLGTTGFPEARQAQEQCQEWLKEKLSS